MGYRTNFRINVSYPRVFTTLEQSATLASMFVNHARSIITYFDSCFRFDLKDGSLFSTDSIKWYEYYENCITISKELKDILIEVSGEGEEPFDWWRAYFLNGKGYKTEKNEICFPIFDKSRLKEYIPMEREI